MRYNIRRLNYTWSIFLNKKKKKLNIGIAQRIIDKNGLNSNMNILEHSL